MKNKNRMFVFIPKLTAVKAYNLDSTVYVLRVFLSTTLLSKSNTMAAA